MLLNIAFWGFIAIWIVAPVLYGIAVSDVIDKLTTKPAAPPHVDTPEEAAEFKAKALARHAQMERSRLEYLAAHQN
jgi:hypothetical protein